METVWFLVFDPRNAAGESLTSEQSKYLLFLLISFCHLGKSAEQLFVED